MVRLWWPNSLQTVTWYRENGVLAYWASCISNTSRFVMGRGNTGKILTNLLILVLPFFVLYWLLPFFSKLTIGNDYTVYSVHAQLEAAFSVANGSFPLYAPGFAHGHSVAALTLGQLFHPFFYIYQLLPNYWHGWAIEWNTFLRLLSIGVTHLIAFKMLQRIGVSTLITLIISVPTIYNLRMLDMFRYGASLENYLAFVALSCVLIFHFLDRNNKHSMMIVFLTYLLVVGGHPQIMYLGLLGTIVINLLIPYFLPTIADHYRRDYPSIKKYYLHSFSLIAGGVLLASVYFIPFYFEFLRDNAVRAAAGYDASLAYSDNFFGLINNLLSPFNADVHGACGGTSVLLLVLLTPPLAMFTCPAPKIIWSIWVILLVILLCSIGAVTPVHYIFWKIIPFADSFRTPGRITMIVPLLSLMILVWIFCGKPSRQTANANKTLLMSSTASILAMLAGVLCGDILLHRTTEFTPARINSLSDFDNRVAFAMNSGILILLGLLCCKARAKHFKRLILAALLLLIMAQTIFVLRFGTWITGKSPSQSFAEMASQKRSNIMFVGDSGVGMSPRLITEQIQLATLQPNLAQFYSDYKTLSSEDEVNEVIKNAGVSHTAVVSTAALGAHVDARVYKDDLIDLQFTSFNKLIFIVNVKSKGIFALNYFYDGRWLVDVDERRQATFKVNGYQTGVYLEPGVHKLEFRRFSLPFLCGMTLSCLSFIFIGGYFIGNSGWPMRYRTTALAIVISLTAYIFSTWYCSLYSGNNLTMRYHWESHNLLPRVINSGRS